MNYTEIEKKISKLAKAEPTSEEKAYIASLDKEIAEAESAKKQAIDNYNDVVNRENQKFYGDKSAIDEAMEQRKRIVAVSNDKITTAEHAYRRYYKSYQDALKLYEKQKQELASMKKNLESAEAEATKEIDKYDSWQGKFDAEKKAYTLKKQYDQAEEELDEVYNKMMNLQSPTEKEVAKLRAEIVETMKADTEAQLQKLNEGMKQAYDLFVKLDAIEKNELQRQHNDIDESFLWAYGYARKVADLIEDLEKIQKGIDSL